MFFTSVIAVSAALTVYHAYRTYIFQGAPKIIVYVKEDRRKPGWLMICVRNIGKSVAVDIKFTFDRLHTEHGRAFSGGPLIEGISLLAPGESREYTWGEYKELVVSVGTAIPVSFSYAHYVDKKKSQDRCELKGKSKLDIRSFYGTDIDEPPDKTKTMKDHLGDISSSVEKIANKNH